MLKAKPLFVEENDLGITIKPPKSKKQLNASNNNHNGDEDDCEQEACIIDDNGKLTSDDYILTKPDFNKWSINQIINKEKSQFTKLIMNNSKQFNENTPFWKFVKQKCVELKSTKYYQALIKGSTKRINQLIKTENNLVKCMTFDEIASIYIYTTDCLYYPLNKSLRNGQNDWSPFAIILISALNKLPLTWSTLYRGTRSQKVNNMVRTKYKVGAILKRDSFYSTSTDLTVAKRFAGAKGTIFIMENTFHGREITKFSQFEGEKEILYSLSSNFIITKIEEKGQLYVRCRELPFPWNLKTILWVDDNLTAYKNNKLFIQRLEAMGVMIIPRISTYETIEFFEFCENAIKMNDFKQFRIITNMERMEYRNGDDINGKINHKEAGVELIRELRGKGYRNNICVYDRKANTKALEKCRKNGYDKKIVFIALELKDIEKWISPDFIEEKKFNDIIDDNPVSNNNNIHGAVPQQREDIVDFKAIVAIDFGTHGTGLGYALINDDEKKQETYIEQDWCANVDNKNKTDILLKYDGTFLAFGEKALNMYLYGDNDSDSDNSNSGTEEEEEEDEKEDNKKHMLFESFKMSLYEGDQTGSDGDIRDQIACIDGRLYSTSKVFIEALKCMKKQIFNTFVKKKINIKSINDIQWILTVPAIWSDRAKYKMEVWALQSKLINKNIYNHLRIVYEPDCASISCQYESINENKINKKNNKIKTAFDIGERYVLIDAGGGTVDIAWHKVKKEYCMEEIHHPTGGPWGSDYIDDEFENLLFEIFGTDSIREFRKLYASNYVRIKNNFQKSKMSFYNNNNNNRKFHKVQLTSEFINYIPTYLDDTIDDMNTIEEFNIIIDNARPFGMDMGELKIENDELFLSYNIWTECLFDKVINPMIEHVEEHIKIVNKIPDKNGNIKNIKYLCIAGGLACSKYFKYCIHESFGINSKYNLSIRIPTRPILSVIDGALKLGLRPNYIQTRRLKYSYGIAVDRRITNVDTNKLPKGYLNTHCYIHPNTRKKTIKNLFSKWVTKNDAVDKGQAFTKQYRRFHKNEQTTKLSIYCSNKTDPYIVEGKPLASVTIKFPYQYKGLPFIVKFYFGDTKISATVLYKDNKQKETKKILSDKLELKYEVM